MGMAEQVRNDFKNVFMADLGQPFVVTRNGVASHEVEAIAESKNLQLYHDADVKEGDILTGKLSNKVFTVAKIEYEVWERERTSMIARCK